MGKNISKHLDDLRRREFQVDCVQMELIRASDGKKFIGAGYIRQSAIQDFEIKIYAEGEIDFREIFSDWGSKKAGVLYGDADHFTIYVQHWTAAISRVHYRVRLQIVDFANHASTRQDALRYRRISEELCSQREPDNI